MTTNQAISQEQLDAVPEQYKTYLENLQKVGTWNGIPASELVGRDMFLGMTSYTIVGVKTTRGNSKLMIWDFEWDELNEVSFKTIEDDLKLQGFIKI